MNDNYWPLMRVSLLWSINILNIDDIIPDEILWRNLIKFGNIFTKIHKTNHYDLSRKQ